MKKNLQRREFMKNALLTGAGASLSGGAGQILAQGSAPLQKVPRRTLGRTGETIPMLFMGGSQKFNLKYDRLLHRAFGMGINYIDTAQAYAAGQSHKGLAPFLEQVGRKNVWITTKTRREGKDNTPEAFRTGLDECLEELQTDYVDMYFMHMIDDVRNLDPDFIKMGDALRKSGKTKFFGFSCHDGNVVALINKAAQVGGIDAIMFRYSFRQYGDLALNKAIDAAHKAGIGLMAMKTQSSVPDDLEKVSEFQSKEFSLAQAKLKSVWADERLSGCVSQMTSLEILNENVKASVSPTELTLGEFNQLNKLARMTAPYACLGCKNICEAKVAGELKIADTLRYLMYDECYGDRETARVLYSALTPAERDFEAVDLADAIRSCPQDIQIDERLRRAKELLSI